MGSHEGLPKVEEVEGPFAVGVISATIGEEAFSDFNFAQPPLAEI